jgi:hypothetical protein
VFWRAKGKASLEHQQEADGTAGAMGFAADYLTAIGLQLEARSWDKAQSLSPSLALLSKIFAAHKQSFAFCSFGVLRGEPILLDADQLLHERFIPGELPNMRTWIRQQACATQSSSLV